MRIRIPTQTPSTPSARRRTRQRATWEIVQPRCKLYAFRNYRLSGTHDAFGALRTPAGDLASTREEQPTHATTMKMKDFPSLRVLKAKSTLDAAGTAALYASEHHMVSILLSTSGAPTSEALALGVPEGACPTLVWVTFETKRRNQNSPYDLQFNIEGDTAFLAAEDLRGTVGLAGPLPTASGNTVVLDRITFPPAKGPRRGNGIGRPVGAAIAWVV